MDEENSEEPKKRKIEFSDAEIADTPTDLNAEIDGEEEELLPPEEESEAREINVGTIFACCFIFVAVIIMVVMLLGGKKKSNKKDKELDKAGSKYEVDFDREIPLDIIDEPEEVGEKEEDDVDEILEGLPANIKPPLPPKQAEIGVAPVAPIGSGSYKSDRPDTRNSKSPRKIEGLKGQAPVETNKNIIAAAMTGNLGGSANQRPRMTKEEYIAQAMANTKSLQERVYGAAGVGERAAAYQQNKENFYSSGNDGAGSGEYLSFASLWDGTVISGALITAINTDNPGVVVARVTENVYSSYDQSLLLIPEGSTLYATYNSSISYGQKKVQVAWNILIRPDGYRVTLGNMNGVDAQGMSGYKGWVNDHPWEVLKALGLIAVYSLIDTEITTDIGKTTNQYMQNALTDVYKQGRDIGNKMIDRALDIKPTITIKAGTEIKLITNTPLELPPCQINPVTRKYIRSR